MRSNEIAKLAGVTVRTLRHYHSLGLLPEPPRSSNGYRNYTASDLARLLRIKRLASLGFPLSRIGEIMNDMDAEQAKPTPDADDSSSPAYAALDELDHELALQIEALQEQRRTIAQLKEERLSPDLPVRFARILRSLSSYQSLEALDANDRTALMLIGHLYNDDEMSELERVVAVLQDSSLARSLEELDARCMALPPDASRAERDQLVEEALALLEPLIAQFDVSNWTGEETAIDRLMDSVLNDGLNPAQLEVTERIERAIEARLTERSTNCSQPR